MPAEMRAAEELVGRLAERAIAMDGTCTGEHGIGQGKIEFLESELGSALDVMRAIKRAIDPLNIMNPGKIVDDGLEIAAWRRFGMSEREVLPKRRSHGETS